MFSRWLFLAFFMGSLLLFTGCVHSTVKLNDAGSLPESERVSLVTDSKNITIESIDQKRVTTLRQVWDNKWDAEVLLNPGEHEIYVKFWNGPTFKQHIESFYLFSLKGIAGHHYQLKHSLSERSAKIWIEDIKTGQRSGKIIASLNEPVIGQTEVFDHSLFFTIPAPEGTGWIIPSRTPASINFAREGSHRDETYGVYVQLVEIPTLNSKEEFLEFVKTDRGRFHDSKRFSIIQDNTTYYEGKEDYCISYYSIAEDKEAKKRSTSKDPMLLEMAGYFCRLPQNKNIGIFFDYSQRYYPGDQDRTLREKAKATFDTLKF
jgi:hypothetical protein